ncbi:MAG: sulfate ABC transporter substrate-binding protein [Frankiaceae bacterium]
MGHRPIGRRHLAGAVLATSALALATGCGASATASNGSKSIQLVAYSTPQKVYSKLIPAFTATAAGKGAKFTQSYGASGAQSRAVLAGQPADIVEFSLEPDMSKLVKAGLVGSSWNAGSYKGMVTDSLVVFVVRKGNPKGIHGWDDIVKPGVKVVTPNVLTSGSAKWNLMAAYGAQIKQGKSPAEALDFVKSVLKSTVAQPDSGSKALAAFTSGTGDVLLSYENEAIEAQQAGQAVDFIRPDQTILIENPIAVTTKAKNAALAKDFVTFLHTDQAQRIFADQGYRPVVKADLDTNRFPTPSQLFTIDDLGGWSSVNTQFFDPDNGSITKIESDLGVSSGS